MSGDPFAQMVAGRAIVCTLMRPEPECKVAHAIAVGAPAAGASEEVDWGHSRIPAASTLLQALSRELSEAAERQVRVVDWTIPTEVDLAVVDREGDMFLGTVRASRLRLRELEAAVLGKSAECRDYPADHEAIARKCTIDFVWAHFSETVKYLRAPVSNVPPGGWKRWP